MNAVITYLDSGNPCAGTNLAVDAGDPEDFCDTFTLNAVASGGAGSYSYSWSPAGPLDDPTSATPTGTVDELTTFTVTVTDNDGCSTEDSVTVEPIPLYGVNLLDIWSTTSGFFSHLDPNGNGIIELLDFAEFVSNLDICVE